MADDQGARLSPEIPLPIRVIRSGQIVYQVGSLGELVTLAATNKLLPSDEIAGPQPGNPIDPNAVRETFHALVLEEGWWRHMGRPIMIGWIFLGLLVGATLAFSWGARIGDFTSDLLYVAIFGSSSVPFFVELASHRSRLQQLRLALAGGGPRPE